MRLGIRFEAHESPWCTYTGGVGDKVTQDGAGSGQPEFSLCVSVTVCESRQFLTTFGTDQRLNVEATFEPDVDLDGFGDESQDNCVQAPNPDLSLIHI